MFWKEINTEQVLCNFEKIFDFFHDCYLKELKYKSGAYVNNHFKAHALNDSRELCIVIQRQDKIKNTIEMRFSGLIKLNLKPISPEYTCEILDSAIFFENGRIYWGDSIDFKKQREQYDGTWLCAEKIAWRVIEHGLGQKEIYKKF